MIARSALIHPTANVYGAVTIGPLTRVGAFVEIQGGAQIGAACKISSHSFICDGVTIGDEVFIGHGVMFCNDRHPRATVDGRLAGPDDWTLTTTHVHRGASVGSGAVILPGVTISPDAVIGAGAVVTRDVPAGRTAVGNPARLLPDE